MRTLGSGLNQLDRSDRFQPISDLSPDQLDPIIQLIETEMVALALNVAPAEACFDHVC